MSFPLLTADYQNIYMKFSERRLATCTFSRLEVFVLKCKLLDLTPHKNFQAFNRHQKQTNKKRIFGQCWLFREQFVLYQHDGILGAKNNTRSRGLGISGVGEVR